MSCPTIDQLQTAAGEQEEHDRHLAYWAARLAADQYARRSAATAARLVREVFPTAATVAFALADSCDAGLTASLVTVRDADNALLWRAEDATPQPDSTDPAPVVGGDLGEDAQITDRLASAESWGYDYFPPARNEPLSPLFSDGTDLRLLDLAAALTPYQPVPAPAGTVVYLLTWEHRRGTHRAAYASAGGARQEQLSIVRDNWADIADQPGVPVAPPADDELAVAIYLAANGGDESFDIEPFILQP